MEQPLATHAAPAAVQLVAPHAEVLFAEDGTLNLGQLFDVPETQPSADDERELFPLRIDQLQLVRGHLAFRDRRP